jgi:hypothetical protein
LLENSKVAKPSLSFCSPTIIMIAFAAVWKEKEKEKERNRLLSPDRCTQ